MTDRTRLAVHVTAAVLLLALNAVLWHGVRQDWRNSWPGIPS